MFDVNDQTLNTGIYKPPDHSSVWLFITREKAPGMTEYRDALEGDVLRWDGQLQGAKDAMIFDHKERGLELLVFYRESRQEFDDYAFRYEGPFDYQSHSGSGPSAFVLTRAGHGPGPGRSDEAAPQGEEKELCLAEVLGGLRHSSKDSVVAENELTDLQRRMHVSDGVEDWVASRIVAWRSSPARRPLLVVLSGNAGDGKSELIERLRVRPELQGADVRVVADATHAETPSQSQAELLVRALGPFGTERDIEMEGAPCVLVAINVGMAIAFFSALEGGVQAERFRALKAVLFTALGLDGQNAPNVEEWACEVVNLDHRNILGDEDGALLLGMLDRLDPSIPGSVTADAASQCGECPVRASCWIPTNLSLLRLPAVREAIRELLWEVSLAEGIHLSPRSVWDFLYHALTGGPQLTETAFLSCEALRAELPSSPHEMTSAQLSLIQRRLLYNAIFETPLPSAAPVNPILAGLARADPIGRTGRMTHAAEGAVLADPRADATALGELALETGESAPEGPRLDPLLSALAALTDALGLWKGQEGEDNGMTLAKSVARRARLTQITPEVYRETVDESTFAFLRLLEAYAAWLPGTDAPEAIEAFWTDSLIAGVEAMFGLSIDQRAYFRLDTFSPASRFPAFVPVDLKRGVRVCPDPVITSRASALRELRYLPRSILATIQSGGGEPWQIAIDLKLFRLLRRVASGYMASSVDLDAFFRLRYACERLGAAGDGTEIIFRSTATGTRYRLAREAGLTGEATRFSVIA